MSLRTPRYTFLPIILFVIIMIGTGIYLNMDTNKPSSFENLPPLPAIDISDMDTDQIDNQETPTKQYEYTLRPSTSTPTYFAPTFSTYKEIPVQVNPKIPAYSVLPDLSNISNVTDFSYLSAEQKKYISKNGFVVGEHEYQEFYPLYESNRYEYVPNFITTDSLLHNYHLVFDHVLKKLEQEKLANELAQLNTALLAESLIQYEAFKGTTWEIAAKRNVGFFAVGSKLLDPTVTIPSIVNAEVSRELALIAAHQKIDVSPVMNAGSQAVELEKLKEDYTQYIPRGHYDTSQLLRAYFKSMMWYGRLSFRLKNSDEIKSAVLITRALNTGSNQARWNTIYEPINFFVGKSDDITYYQFKDVFAQVYGSQSTLNLLSTDTKKFDAFVTATKKLDPPQVNSIPIFNSTIQPNRENEIKAFRFMGQRFTIDAAIFQKLIDRDVPGRMLPKGLDIPAAFGSKEAFTILTELGETKYPQYQENMKKMQTHLAQLSTETWTQNLYWGWLNTLRPLVTEKPEGYPSFMRTSAWNRKELNTFLGSWTELKHDTILYAKQVYAEMGGGGPEENDDRGYVEPNPYVYARLASLLRMTRDGLEARALLTTSIKDMISKMETLALSLKTISEKELNGQPLTANDYELIRSYGGQLEHFWLEVNKDEPAFRSSSSQRDYLNENPAALIADVATDPNGTVLEEAIGNISPIYVVVPIEGKLRLTKGGVYSYYEFTQPMSERLTDAQWRAMLKAQKEPSMPSWTKAFIAK
jgi:hypothetical protein